jgi:hypothetical protein
MARTKANKAQLAIPEVYRGDFLNTLDQTKPVGQAMHDRFGMVLADLGGDANIATVKRSTARDWACLDVLIESLFCRLADGKKVDVGALTQLLNSKLGLARQLGLERKARTVRSLHEVMRAGSAP